MQYILIVFFLLPQLLQDLSTHTHSTLCYLSLSQNKSKSKQKKSKKTKQSPKDKNYQIITKTVYTHRYTWVLFVLATTPRHRASYSMWLICLVTLH